MQDLAEMGSKRRLRRNPVRSGLHGSAQESRQDSKHFHWQTIDIKRIFGRESRRNSYQNPMKKPGMRPGFLLA
jgi:hypothetical protein